MNWQPRVLNATTIIGNKVISKVGEPLGVIKDLIIDLDDAQIAYVALSFGNLFGPADKLFAIPLEALTFDTKANTVLLDLDVEKEVLKEAPGFD